MSEQFDNNQTPQIQQPELPMKWHKFLVYFALWAGAVINIGMGIVYLTQLGDIRADAKTIVAVYAIGSIALGIYGIKVCLDLLRFKKGGPKALFILYIAVGILNIVFLAGSGQTLAENVAQVIAPFAWAFINRTYYNKRDHLFVN